MRMCGPVQFVPCAVHLVGILSKWADPEDWFWDNRWDKDVYDKAAEANDEERQRVGPDSAQIPRSDGKEIREQAQALLEGREKWRPMWVDYGPPREVELELDAGKEADVPLTREKV